MKLVNFIAVFFLSLWVPSANADEPEFKFTQLEASSDLPQIVMIVWENTPDKCSKGYEEGQDLIADLFGTVVEGKDKNKIYILPCGAPAAYNTSEIVIAVNWNASETRIFAIPSISERGPSADMLGPGLQWDEEASVITSFYKGRGLGDCGGNSTLMWDGEYYSNLVLIEQHTKIECDGQATEWPKVWPLE